ncbi:MAG: LamG-like jellyroll fold domain-containing protein [Planctomycetota bacterium]|jgi:TolA-binding protein
MNNKLAKFMVLLVVLLTGLADDAARADIEAHWTLDETSGTKASDSTYHQHNGILQGGLSFDTHSGPGVLDKALQFNGGNHRVYVESFQMPSDAPTIALWFCPDSSLDRGAGEMWLLSWINPNRPSLIFNKHQMGKICLHNVNRGDIPVQTRTNAWRGGVWHHIAVTFKKSDYNIYVDGVLERTFSSSDQSVTGASKLYLGGTWSGKNSFVGKLDDIRVYGTSLTAAEIAQLARLPAIEELLQAAYGAEVLLKHQKPQEAIAFLEKAIAEHEKTAVKIAVLDKAAGELYIKLAQAKQAAGFPQPEILSAYRRAIYRDRLAPSAITANAQRMVSEGKLKAGTELLQQHLAEYDRWQQEHRYDAAVEGDGNVPRICSQPDSLPEIYFQLGQMREAAAAPKMDIADAYSKTFASSPSDYTPEQTLALIWLLDNECPRQYTQIINSLAQDSDPGEPLATIVSNLYRWFELKDNWPGFERLLDTLFTEAKSPSEWMIFVESRLKNTTSRWAKKYAEYLDRNSRLKFDKDCALADKYAAHEEYSKAAELYRDILLRCGPKDDKRAFEYRLCKYLFSAGKYRKAASQLDGFIARNKTTNRELVEQAMLMKAQIQIQLGEYDKATDGCFTLMMEYPETEQVAEASFLMGYCRMLQGDFAEATEAFNIVVRDYPQSGHANKARLYLTRIKNITQ